MSQLRSGNQAAQPQRFVPEHHGQPCFSPRAGKTASPTAQEDAISDLGSPQQQIPQFQRGWSVCWDRASACVLSHGQTPCTATSGLGSKAASTSQPSTISKKLSTLLQSKSKQNTTTDTICKTKSYLSWDLRTHTKLPAGVPTRQPQPGLLEAPPQLMLHPRRSKGAVGATCFG